MADPGVASGDQLTVIERLKSLIGEEAYDKVVARMVNLLDLDPDDMKSDQADCLANWLRAEITG